VNGSDLQPLEGHADAIRCIRTFSVQLFRGPAIRPPFRRSSKQHMLYRLMADETSRREGGKRDVLAAVAAAPRIVG
jgi:hypothetical protein